jgi:hypothetical protein
MRIFACSVLVLIAAGCDGKKTDDLAHSKMNPVMKTQCIGRSLVDLPDGYTLKTGASAMFTPIQDVVESAKIDLRITPITDKAAFVAQVKARHAELAAAGSGETDRLTLAREISDGGMLYRVREIDDAYQSEIHWLLRDQYLVATIHSYKNQMNEAEELLYSLMKNIAYQDEPTAASKAFCFSRVAVGGNYRAEAASLRFKNALRPDISFSVDVDTFRRDDTETLLQRVGGPNSLLRKFKAKESVLRKGELEVAGMRAQEWGASIMLGEDEDEKKLGLTLETMRSVPSPSAPKIHLEMDVSGRSAPDEKGALLLWDSVVRTIRQPPH